jgi:hypothetical protein
VQPDGELLDVSAVQDATEPHRQGAHSGEVSRQRSVPW